MDQVKPKGKRRMLSQEVRYDILFKSLNGEKRIGCSEFPVIRYPSGYTSSH